MPNRLEGRLGLPIQKNKMELPKKACAFYSYKQPMTIERCGGIWAYNSSLVFFVGDFDRLSKWAGVGEDVEHGEWDTLRAALGDREWSSVDLGGGPVLVVNLTVGAGRAEIFRTPAGLVAVESFEELSGDLSPEVVDYLAAPPQRPVAAGRVESPSRVVAWVPWTDPGVDLDAAAARARAHGTAVEDCRLLVAVEPGSWMAFMEPERRLRSGPARRFVLQRG